MAPDRGQGDIGNRILVGGDGSPWIFRVSLKPERVQTTTVNPTPSPLSGVHVLVTGATGFVGHRLAPLPDAGHEVTALVRDAGRDNQPPGVRVVGGGLLERESIDAADYLVHVDHTPFDGAVRLAITERATTETTA